MVGRHVDRRPLPFLYHHELVTLGRRPLGELRQQLRGNAAIAEDFHPASCPHGRVENCFCSELVHRGNANMVEETHEHLGCTVDLSTCGSRKQG